MDEHAMQQYLDQVPVEIREAIMELDTPPKWAVYIALTVDGDKYFNQLKKEFKANPKTLTDILKSLVASGLVDRKVKQLVDAGDTNKNYYTTTKMGEKLLMNLYEVVLPPHDEKTPRHEKGGRSGIHDYKKNRDYSRWQSHPADYRVVRSEPVTLEEYAEADRVFAHLVAEKPVAMHPKKKPGKGSKEKRTRASLAA
ncbi:MAG: hypothetical protein GYA23_10885 [Methanomicrobiales archaeon]|nr:hypothetical protein [Methanomicrobiales archaeon]